MSRVRPGARRGSGDDLDGVKGEAFRDGASGARLEAKVIPLADLDVFD